MKPNIKAELHNEFEIVVRDAKTEEIKRSVKGYNIILSRFWSLFLTAGSTSLSWSHIHFGSGTAVPLASDTTLTTLTEGRACASDLIDTSKYASDGIISRKRSIRLQDTEYVGTKISEVGIGNGASSLLTKCLIKDGNGNPISITKGESEIIDIYATWFAKFPLGYINSDLICIGQPDKGLQKLCTLQGSKLFYNSSSGWNVAYYDKYQLQPNCLSSYWIGHTYNAGNIAVSFDVPNKKVSWGIPNVVAANANVGGIRSLIINDSIGIRIPEAFITQSPLTKEVIGTGDGINTKFNTLFGFIKNNSNFKVYVNDVEVSVKKTIFDTMVPQSNILPGINYLDWPRTLETIPFMSSLGDSNEMGVADIIFENPLYSYGVDTVSGSKTSLYSADSPSGPWTLAISAGTTAIPVAHKYKRYWKHPGSSVSGSRFTTFNSTAFASEKLIELNSAPPAGATVTCTYDTGVIAKDANHVLHNMKVEMVFGEYTP